MSPSAQVHGGGRVRPGSEQSPVIAALDTADLGELSRASRELAPVVGRMKIGLEAYVAHGPAAVEAVRSPGGQQPGVFLDLKLHDIPTTVRGATAAVADLGVAMVTVHAAGGPAMVAAAAQVADGVDVLAVTILTSMDDAALASIGQPPVTEQVVRLGRLAVDAGAAGLICASTDVARLRLELGSDPLLVVPGIRPQGTDVADQARVGTPEAAMAAGADWLVVGRPILHASDPVAAARLIWEEADAGYQRRQENSSVDDHR